MDKGKFYNTSIAGVLTHHLQNPKQLPKWPMGSQNKFLDSNNPSLRYIDDVGEKEILAIVATT